MNGVENQVIDGYMKFQVGHVVVEWEAMNDIDLMDKTKYLTNVQSYNNNDMDRNNKSVELLKDIWQQNENDIDIVIPVIKKNVQFVTDDGLDSIVLYGITKKEKDYLLDSSTLNIIEGTVLSEEENTICISEEKAEINNLTIGDTMTFTIVDENGTKKKVTCNIIGIYENKAGYDNLYGFMNFDELKALYNLKYFDYAKVFLKDSDKSYVFADKIDEILSKNNASLVARDFMEASQFYTNNPKIIRSFFNIFIIMFLFIIIIGFRSTIKMNLITRYKEFGTLRAIGYSKVKCYIIIFLEVLLLSLMALSLALILSLSIVIIVNMKGNGVYVGSGAITYVMGGERFYPFIKENNIIVGIGLMVLFSLISTFSPSVKMLNTNIVDLLAQRFKKKSLLTLKKKK
jgi:ABC-type lipoprotein release transport system permease subunit